MSVVSRFAVVKVVALAGMLTMIAATASNANAACPPFTVYTKNAQRSLMPMGPEGPLGDLLVVSGPIYETPSDTASPVGQFDLSAITTSTNNPTERRQVSIETSFDKSFIRMLNKSKILCGTSKGFGMSSLAQTDDISVTGVEPYPMGGGILTNPIVFGISAGTGQFVGAEGSVHISFDPATQFFTYVFTLLPR